MEINAELIQLLNNRNHDLSVELGFLRQLGNVDVTEVPSVTKTTKQITKKLQKRLKTKEETIEGLQTAIAAAEFKMKTYLNMDRNTGVLESLGATKSTISGLNKLRDSLEKEVFSIYSISESDFSKEEEGESNE